MRILDPEVEILASCAATLREDYLDPDENIWQESPFAWIRVRPSRQKGAIGEKLISGYLATKGFDVIRSPDREADRIIGGKRAEIKMSFLWENGSYTFQQIRDQNYEFMICLGISPFSAHCWVLPKRMIMTLRKEGKISPQHGGKGGVDTAWLIVNPKTIPAWLEGNGGSLSAAVKRITEITGQSPL